MGFEYVGGSGLSLTDHVPPTKPEVERITTDFGQDKTAGRLSLAETHSRSPFKVTRLHCHPGLRIHGRLFRAPEATARVTLESPVTAWQGSSSGTELPQQSLWQAPRIV